MICDISLARRTTGEKSRDARERRLLTHGRATEERRSDAPGELQTTSDAPLLGPVAERLMKRTVPKNPITGE